MAQGSRYSDLKSAMGQLRFGRFSTTPKQAIVATAFVLTLAFISYLSFFQAHLKGRTQLSSSSSRLGHRRCSSSTPRCRARPVRPIPPNCTKEAGIDDRESFCSARAPDDPPFEALASKCKSYSGPNGIRRGTFLFLVQGEGAPSGFWDAVSERKDASILWLSWKEEVPEDQRKGSFADYVFYPKSSFNRGRNRLLRRGLELELEQGWLFEFFVFMDEDQDAMEFTNPKHEDLVNDLYTGKERCPPTVALLIHLLLKYRAARSGIQVINWKEGAIVSEDGCMSTSSLDGNVEAFHRTALIPMMPYTSRYDEVVVWMGNSMMNAKADLILGPYAVKFNQLVTYPFEGKQKHTDYPFVQYAAHSRNMYCFINYCLSPEARRGRFFFSSEGSGRLFLRIRVMDGDDSAPCYQMSSTVDYSALIDTEFMEKNWFT